MSEALEIERLLISFKREFNFTYLLVFSACIKASARKVALMSPLFVRLGLLKKRHKLLSSFPWTRFQNGTVGTVTFIIREIRNLNLLRRGFEIAALFHPPIFWVKKHVYFRINLFSDQMVSFLYCFCPRCKCLMDGIERNSSDNQGRA